MNVAIALLAGLAIAPQGAGFANPRVREVSIPIAGSNFAKLHLVEFGTSTPLCDLAEAKVAAAETHEARLWVRESLDLIKDMPEFLERLYYECDSSLKYDSRQLLSVFAHAEYYSGGAHPMRNTRTYNFGLVAGKPARFGVSEAFLRDKPSRVALQDLLIGRARLLDGTDWLADGMVKYLSDEQLGRFWVDRDDLVWEFDPYELGPYVAGTFTLRIPRMDVRSLIKSDGPLGSWASR